MKSWEFYDCIKYKDFGDGIIKTDEYIAGLWFLVQFGGDFDSYIIYIGLFQCIGGYVWMRRVLRFEVVHESVVTNGKRYFILGYKR